MSTLDPHVPPRGIEFRNSADVIHEQAICSPAERVVSWGLGT